MPKSSSDRPAPRSRRRVSIWAEYSGFSITRLSVISILREPGRTPRAGDDRLHVLQQIVAQKVMARHVDAGEDRRLDLERVLPRSKLAAGLLQQEHAQLDDEAGFLGNRHEVLGADPAEPGMIPAQHRLEAGDGPVLQAHDRLEQHLHLVAVDRMAKVGFHREMVAAVGAHGRAEHLDPVAAVAARMGHGDLGVAQHLLAPRGDLRIVEGDADGGGEEDLALRIGERGRHHAADHVGEGDDAVGLALGEQDDGEFVARDARQGILRLEQAARGDGTG